MNWLQDWRALSARIEGLVTAARAFAELRPIANHDQYGIIGRSLLPELTDVLKAVDDFLKRNRDGLPPGARDVLARAQDPQWRGAMGGGDLTGLAPLVLLRSQMEFALRDTEVVERHRAELAFTHLRRSIVVDGTIRETWHSTFSNGNEPQCERLGAVHLLSHRIWAFKAHGSAAATDLVLSEPVEQEMGEIQRSGATLVLTEWKVVRDPKDLQKKAVEARRQTDRYQSGILGALELRRTRYIVLVTDDDWSAPQDVDENGVQFRHVVIPTNPKNASAVRTVVKS